MDEIQSIRAKRLRIPQEDMFQMNLGNGNYYGKLPGSVLMLNDFEEY